MEHFKISESSGGWVVDGIPNAAGLISLVGPLARRLSDLSLHREDLLFARQALDTLDSYLTADFVREALWRTAIIHYYKCFGDGVRFQLTAKKIYATSPPESLEAFEYLKALRNKHFVHDENAYAQCLTGAVLNGGDKDYKVEKIVSLCTKAVTLVEGNFRNLSLLADEALNWVTNQFDELCVRISDDLEARTYADLMALGALSYQVPVIEQAFRTRD